MTYLTKTTLAVTLALGALGATAVVASNGDMLRIKDQLHLRDASCVDRADLLLADESLTPDQVILQLRDGSCLLEDDPAVVDDDTDDTVVATPLQTRTRTRTGAENGQGSVTRTRSEGDGRK